MQLKYFEEKLIPSEIHKFYDDLANIYLKSDYDYGTSDNKSVPLDKLGRYKQSRSDIYIIEDNIDLSFLIYTKEGYLKQDEIVLNYDKYVVLDALKEIIENFLNEIMTLDKTTYTDGVTNINREDLKDKNLKTIKVNISGLIIASHIFGIRKIMKFFVENICYVDENKIPLTYYLNIDKYDLSFILGDMLELIFPKASEEDLKKIDDKKLDEFIGQNQKDIIEQLKKELKEEDKKTPSKKNKAASFFDKAFKKILDKGLSLGSEYVKKLISEKFKDENKENEEKSYIIQKNKKNIEKIKEKFKKDYGDKKYGKYFEDVTNRKIKKKDKENLNEILRGKDKKNNSVIKQEDLKDLKKILKSEISTIDYLYHICSKSKNPLQTLEESLMFLTCKYDSNTSLNTMNILKNTFSTKLKNQYINFLNKINDANIKSDEKDYIENLGLVDVDDISIDIEFLELEEYKDLTEYKLLKLFKDQNLVKESFSTKDSYGRKYKKARRLLDNIQNALIKSMVRIKNEEFDGYKNKDKNILNKYIIYLDEKLLGLSFDEYSFFYNMPKKVGITVVFLSIIKSKYTYRDDMIAKISSYMYGKKYDSYTDGKNRSSDKANLIKVFPSYASLEYNMKLRKSNNIARFYEKLYEDKENSEDMFFVCDKAKVSCSFSSDVSILNVFDSDKIIENKKSASVKDKDIVPFKACSSNKICSPNLSDWEVKVQNLVKSEFALMSSSKSFCSLGGVISIVDPNQSKYSIKKIEAKDTKKKYELYDYVAMDKEFLNEIRNMYFSYESRNAYKSLNAINSIEKGLTNYLRKRFKAKLDLKKLENENVIVAYDPYRKALVNIKTLSEYIKGYYLSKNFRHVSLKNKNEIMGASLSNKSYLIYIAKVIQDLDILFSPYNENVSKNDIPYWMDRVFEEYEANRDMKNLEKNVIKYHKYGANLNADIKTPWCASFVNYIMDNGLKSASSQIYYKKEGRKYYKKIDNPRYGAIAVFKYSKNRGHVSFFISETKDGIYLLGGNQGGRIKKSYYDKKNNKLYGYFWPL